MPPRPPDVPTPTAEFEPDSVGPSLQASATLAALGLDQQSDCPVKQITASTEQVFLHIRANIDLSIRGAAPIPAAEKRISLSGSMSVASGTQRPNSQAETLATFPPLDRARSGREAQTIDERDFGEDGAQAGGIAPSATNEQVPQAAIAAIHGQGLPKKEEILQSTAVGSLVFDLGDRFAIRAQRGPLSDYEPQSGSVLKRRLLDAKICWDPANPDAGFIPRRKLIQIVNKDAVKEELSWKSLLQNMHLPRKDLASEAEKICGSGEPSFSLGGGQPVHHLGSEETPCSPSQLQPRQTLGAPQKSFRKIMAILVLIGKPSKIRRFLKEDISDADLPLYKLPVPNSTLRWELRSARGDPKKMIRCFHGWKHHALSEFERRQWTVLTAFFAPGGMSELGRGRHPRIIHHWVLGESVVLPFEYQDESSPPGGCGQVMKVTIHPDHHVFNLPSTKEPNVFAVKRLKSKRREDFDRETSMLKRLSGDYEHAHLIVLLATYQHRGSYHLIFPWAEADLVGYWEKLNPIPDRNPTTAQWLIRQCQGLADALATIHHFPTFSNDSLLAGTKNPTKQPPGPKSKVVDLDPVALRRRSICKVLFGVHGDIKPPNILWFPGVSSHPDDLGTLKITDFGTAEFTRDGTSSPSGGSPFYRAPEVDIPGAVPGPAYDIWALGCVFLEFVTWYLQGWNGVECFGRKRSTLDNHRTLRNIKTPTFFTMDKNTRPATPVVKREVTEYIHLLRTDPCVHCAKFVEEFLDLIVNQILVADLSKGKRMAAGHLAEKFSAMLSNTDEHYWTMPR